MKEIIISCEELTHISQFHAAVARELNFPGSYGANLDALHDLLTSLSQPTKLNLHGLLRAHFSITALLRVLNDCQKENANLHIYFGES